MFLRGWFTTLFLFTFGCSSVNLTPVPLDLPGIPRDVDPSLALMTGNGQAGHGCPVDGAVYTARHVMWNRELGQFEGASWSSRGEEGGAVVSGVSPISDIVELGLSPNTLVYLPRGSARVGERVYWFEYDFRTKANALRARRRFAVVLRIVARQYVLDEIPVGGASGSCLINERGEAIAIVTGGWELTDGKFVGVAPKLPETF
jgi:hypothetical protein